MLTRGNLILERYLMLQRSAHFLPWETSQQVFSNRLGFRFKEINLLIPCLLIEDEDESILEEFLCQIIHDRDLNWFSFMFVVDEDCATEFDLYIHFMIDQILDNSTEGNNSAKELSVFTIPLQEIYLPHLADAFRQGSLSVGETPLPSTVGENAVYWDDLKIKLDAYYHLGHDHIFSDLLTSLSQLPELKLSVDQSLVENLYCARLAKSTEFGSLAADYFHRQQWTEAIEYYQKAIFYNPFKSVFWLDRGAALLQLQKYLDAKKSVQTSIVLDSPQYFHYNTLGLIDEALEEWEEATEAYQKAIEINPRDGNSYCNLGNLLIKLNQLSDAIEVYQKGIEENPFDFYLYWNLGNLFLHNDRPLEAIVQYQKALYLSPNNIDVYRNLGIAYQSDPSQAFYYRGMALELQNKIQDAIGFYKISLGHNPFNLNSLSSLASCYHCLNENALLDALIKDSIDLFSTQPVENIKFRFIRELLNYWNYRGEHLLSQAFIQNSTLFQTSEILSLFAKLNLPILYRSEAEIDWVRQDFINTLDAVYILLQSNQTNPTILRESFAFIQALILFFVNYQEKNDLVIQEKTAFIIHAALAHKYPQWMQEIRLSPRKANAKIRVGYISSHLRQHNGGNWAIGWVKNHDRSIFEIYSYHLGEVLDNLTQDFFANSDCFRHIPTSDFADFENWLVYTVEKIRNDRLDVLIFTDIGMEIRSVLLSKLRLAFIQCMSWAHPMTSGSPTIDYFLSSTPMEPDNASFHYSEKVVYLPKLSWCYSTPVLPPLTKNRDDFQLPNDRIIYLSCQSLFKYLPQYDYIYPRIVEQIPNAHFVFLEIFNVKAVFLNRLEQEFNKFNLSAQDYCSILPRQSSQDFLQLQGLSDIYLDTLGWSGGNTTLQAITWGLPVVTYPKEFMRSRHSAAILQILGITETIASSEAEYIQIAIELGLNSAWRKSISEKLKNNHDRIFNDLDCVQALEKFLYYAVHRDD
ncbi:MAG: tetratricopeptide repeat protein [Prochlorotrichaceae cyanobacterium]